MEKLVAELAVHVWIIWVIAAACAGFFEVLLPSFTFAFLSGSCLVAATSSFWLGWEMQMLAFALSLILSVVFFRPAMLKRFHVEPKIFPTRTQAMQGLQGEVTEDIDFNQVGRVLVEGHDWAAASDTRLFKGQKIVVVGSESIVLKVKEI